MFTISVISLILGIISIGMSIYVIITTNRWKRRLKIELNNLVDTSHSLVLNLDKKTPTNINEQIIQLNHKITYLLSIFPDLATQWISVNKEPYEWKLWAQKLQVPLESIIKHKNKS